MPKLHKNPYNYRFIAASHKCTTKPLSRFLNSALRLILKHFREYCLGIYRNTGVNAFWIVENSLEVLDSLRSIPTRKAQLASFDFSTLYTAIPHNLLKDKITNLIHSAYTCRKSQYIEVCQDKAFWSNNVSNKAVTAVHLVELFNYLIDNIYVCVDGSVFKQCVGIPMGTDCAPVVANLFLFAYEYEFMKGLLKDNITLAIKFSNTYRYIDDLLCINNKDFELIFCPLIIQTFTLYSPPGTTDRETCSPLVFTTTCPTSTGTPRSRRSYLCLLYTSPSPRDRQKSRMPSSA